MADVLLTEEGPDTKTDSSESDTNSFENRCGMTQKQDGGDSDTFAIDDSFGNPDDLLPPVVKLEKYANSDIVFNRQVVARNLLETLRLVAENQEEVASLITILCTLADDYEPSVRAELMEQVPPIAAFCHENYQLCNLIQQYLVPMIIKYLTDINNQVRKTSQASVLLMVEQGLINEVVLEEKICPLVLQLTETSQMDDHRTEAVALMSKLAVLVGKDVTEKLFLKRFATLCLDSSFHVRKVCASSFGEFCAIVGREATEKQLLHRFFSLCDDGVWGVRKACAEVFMPISCVCSMETRHKELAPIYMDLLCDQSRWVRMAAFQALGPFISTFAEPTKTGLYYNKEGVLTIVDVPSSIANRTVKSTLVPNKLREASNDEQTSCNQDSTENPCNSCDTVVPSDGIIFSCSPDTTHQSGKYCTVIDVSSSAHTFNQSTVEAREDHRDSKYSSCDQNDATQLLNDDSDSPPNSEHDSNSSSPHLEMQKTSNVSIDSSSLHEKAEDELNEKQETCLVDDPTVTSCCNGEIDGLTNDIDCLSLGEKAVHYFPDSSEGRKRLMRRLDYCVANKVTVNGLDVTSLETELDINSSSTLQFLSCPEDCDSEDVEMNETPAESDASSWDCAVSPADPDTCNNESAFNHFQFWRLPLPDVEIEDDGLSSENETDTRDIVYEKFRRLYREKNLSSSTETQSTLRSCIQSSDSSTSPSNDLDYVQTLHVTSSNYESYSSEKELRRSSSILDNDVLDINSSEWRRKALGEKMSDQWEFQKSNSERDREPPPTSQNLVSAHDQDIVPPELLLRYLSMTDASRAQSVDAEIARHCAYSLPAVALTLGRRFWPCLKDTYNTLASDMQGFIMQWKVRRTLASSMHQLAVILGPDIAAQDLLPIFSGFIKDLDEVRIGILQHLSEFLVVLRPKERKDYLPRLTEFLNTDNDRNWRFRQIFAEQLISVTDLYEPADVREYLVPLSLALVKDKVSEVRLIAVRVMAVMMRRMSQSPTSDLTKEVLTNLADQFMHAPKWLHRQLYVYLCQEFVKESSLPPDQFGEYAMPNLLYLCWDRVANVRLAIARCLAVVIWPNDTFSDPNSPHCELLLQAVHALQSDTDADVQYFANMVATHGCTCLQHNSIVNDDMDEPPV